jgi:hypothetical protein
MKLRIPARFARCEPLSNRLMLSLFGVMLLETIFTLTASSFVHMRSLFLAWTFWIRVFLKKPSMGLAVFSVLSATTCIAADHGLLWFTPILRSFYFYILCYIVILSWDQGSVLFERFRKE